MAALQLDVLVAECLETWADWNSAELVEGVLSMTETAKVMTLVEAVVALNAAQEELVEALGVEGAEVAEEALTFLVVAAAVPEEMFFVAAVWEEKTFEAVAVRV